MNDIAEIGDNNPPSPFDEHSKAVNDLYDESKLWLDGEKITTEEMSESVSNLMNSFKDAAKAAEAARVKEKKPFKEGGEAVDAKYKVLKLKFESAIKTFGAALKPYLEEKDRIAKEKAAALQKEADEKARIAQEAIDKANEQSLEEQENVIALREEAAKTQRIATAVAKKSTATKTTIGRAVGLRKRKVAVITDLSKAAGHFWGTEEGKEAFRETVQKLANSNMGEEIPGIEIQEVTSV